MTTPPPTVEVTQKAGWLLKRGEGFDDNPDKPVENATGPPNRARKGSTVGSKLQQLLKGSSERKRWFVLVSITLQQPGGRINSLKASARLQPVFGKAELRYYAKPDDAQPKGVIEITDECQLVSSPTDVALKLVTPGRTYYLRPDGDPTSASARTESSQWADVLKREIRHVRTLPSSRRNLALSPDAASPDMSSPAVPQSMRLLRSDSAGGLVDAPEREIPHSMEQILGDAEFRASFHDFLETALASENLDFVDAIEALQRPGGNTPEAVMRIMDEFVRPGSPREVNISSSQRDALCKLSAPKLADFDDAKATIVSLMESNFLKRYIRDAQDKTGAFAALYAQFGLDGWNSVLDHFGPVRTDIERSQAALKLRVARAEAQVAVLQKEFASASREVAESMQPGMGTALTRLYHVSVVRHEKLKEYIEELKDQALAPMAALATKLEEDLNRILKGVATSIQLLQEARALHDVTKADLDNARNKGLPTEPLKRDLMECEAALEHAEAANSKPIEHAMAKLESLELYRIEEQTRIITHAVRAEHLMNEDLLAKVKEYDACVQSLQVDSEIFDLIEEVDAVLG